MKLRTCITTLALLAVTLSLSQAAAYIKFDGVDGEAVHPDGGGDGWIIIESLSIPTGRDSRGGVTAEEMICVKELDKATPLLMEKLCTGATIQDLTISLTRTIKGVEKEYYRVTVKNLGLRTNTMSLVRELDKSSTKAVEQVTLGYTEVEWTYIVLDTEGNMIETIKRSFEFGTN